MPHLPTLRDGPQRQAGVDAFKAMTAASSALPSITGRIKILMSRRANEPLWHTRSPAIDVNVFFSLPCGQTYDSGSVVARYFAVSSHAVESVSEAGFDPSVVIRRSPFRTGCICTCVHDIDCRLCPL
jgi:hypothetical protein